LVVTFLSFLPEEEISRRPSAAAGFV